MVPASVLEVTKDTMPAKCLAHSERSESATFCYYLQQTGKPVGNPGSSGKLGVVGWPSRSQAAGMGAGWGQGGAAPRRAAPPPARPLGPRSLPAGGRS